MRRRRERRTMQLIIALVLSLLAVGATLMLTHHEPVPGFEDLKHLHTVSQGDLDYHRFANEQAAITKDGIPITQFTLTEKRSLTETSADVDVMIGKAFAHTTSAAVKERDLYIPKKPGQDKVRICENAQSLEEIYAGCLDEANVTGEYVLSVHDNRVSVTADGKQFIVHDISGTGGVGEGAWWNESYKQRQNLNITPQGENISKDHTITITIDTANLTGQGKLQADGDDLRVVYWNGTANKELDRLNSTPFNTSSTELEFKTQAAINSTTYDYYLYYGNSQAHNPPENKSAIYYYFEDFEDQAHEFTSGTLNPTVTTAAKKHGQYGLEGDGLGGYRRAARPETLNRGFTIEAWVYSGYAGDNADLPGICFGMQASELQGYQTIIDWRSSTGGSSDMQIREDYNSGSPLATSTANTVTADTWYYIEATWHENGDINATIYDENMQPHGTLHANDQTYTSGYYGINAYRDGFWDDVKVTLHAESAPSIARYDEETLGPVITNTQATPSIAMRGQNITINATITAENAVATAAVNLTGPDNTTSLIAMTNQTSKYTATMTLSDIGTYTARIIANDSAGKMSSSEPLTFTINGYASLESITITPSTITQATVANIVCRVIDENTSQGINGYPVSITSNETGSLGTKYTNITGHARVNYLDVSIGKENITCTISDNAALHYAATGIQEQHAVLLTNEPASLTIVTHNASPQTGSHGQAITINAEVTSPNTIENVIATVTEPDLETEDIALTHNGGDTYQGIFNDTWQNGNYSISIWTNDSASAEDRSTSNTTVTIAASTSFAIATEKQAYATNEAVTPLITTDYWWDTHYAYRRQLTITNNDAEQLKANYTLNMTINTSGLIAAGKMRNDCDDLRITHKEGNAWTELDRMVEACGTQAATIRFAAQDGINAGQASNEYRLYYGNSQASEPSSAKEAVYLVWDDFENYTANTHPGNGWADDPEYATNDWRVQQDAGNQVVQDMATDGVYHRLWKGSDGWDDYEIRASAKLDSFLFSGVAFRRQPLATDHHDHYAAIMDDRASTDKLDIRRWTGGGSSYNQLVGDDTDFDGAAWHEYTIRVIGNHATISRDNATYIDYDLSGSNPTYSNGSYVGLMSHQGQTMFDNVTARLILTNEPSIVASPEEAQSLNATLRNEKPYATKGRLIMSVSRNQSGSIIPIATIINDTMPRTINGGASMDLTEAWNAAGGWNTTATPAGTYLLQAYLADGQGMTLTNADDTPIKGSAQFTIIDAPPSVSLLAPGNKKGQEGSNATFSYLVNSTIAIDHCTLMIDGEANKTSNSVTKAIAQNITTTLTAGTYTWTVNCTDEKGTRGSAASRTVTIIEASTYDGQTTSMSNEDIENITGLTLESIAQGQVQFTESVNLSGGADINSHVQITRESITIDTAQLPALNKSAIITFYERGYQHPIILKDGQACTACSIIANTGNLTFSVPHFTTYTASENAQLSIGDETDTSAKYPFEQVNFTANYTNRTSGQAIAGAGISCGIIFSDTGEHPMSYDAGTGLYRYNRTFTTTGPQTYTINCTDTNNVYASLETSEEASISEQEGPRSPASIDLIGSERANLTDNPGIVQPTSGIITHADIATSSLTLSWQGFYGNINATIDLSGGSETFYRWQRPSVSGEIYAARTPSVDFASADCSQGTDITAEESYLGQLAADPDSVTNTFDRQQHPGFSIGNRSIAADSCASTNMYANGEQQTTSYYELLLSDDAGNTIYTALLENDEPGYDSQPYDFQMLVGENGQDTQATGYYFYVELD